MVANTFREKKQQERGKAGAEALVSRSGAVGCGRERSAIMVVARTVLRRKFKAEMSQSCRRIDYNNLGLMAISGFRNRTSCVLFFT